MPHEESCQNCKWMHKLEHNFQTGVGFQKSYACIALLHCEGGDCWIQETAPTGMCELWQEGGNDIRGCNETEIR